MGLTSPDAVTVWRSSGFTSSLTVVTSATSLRLANTLMIMISASTTTADTAIIIFFFRVKAINSSFAQGVKSLVCYGLIILHKNGLMRKPSLVRVTLTSENGKQFQ